MSNKIHVKKIDFFYSIRKNGFNIRFYGDKNYYVLTYNIFEDYELKDCDIDYSILIESERELYSTNFFTWEDVK